MPMGIHRISAMNMGGMPSAMPVRKPSRVASVDSGERANVLVAGTTRAAVQASSRPQTDDASSPEQAHAAFQYALAALQDNAGTSSGTIAQSSPDQGQAGGVQQAGSAYAQVEQAAGQALDITA
jgi:hypothetical protein